MSEFAWVEGLPVDESLVLREGSSLRSADQLKVVFIFDALNVIEDLMMSASFANVQDQFLVELYTSLRSRSLHAEENHWETTTESPRRLTATGFWEFSKTVRGWAEGLDEELSKDPLSSWFDRDENGLLANGELAGPEELCEDLQDALNRLGLWVTWDDGFRIEPAHPEDCIECEASYGEPHEYVSGFEWRSYAGQELSGRHINKRVRNSQRDLPLGVIVGLQMDVCGDGRQVSDLRLLVKVRGVSGEVSEFEMPMYGMNVDVEMDRDSVE